MTGRRAFLIGAALVGWPVTACAQQVGKAPKVGFLAIGRSPIVEAFLLGLHELGYVEGRNIFIEQRFAEGDAKRTAVLAAELVRLRVDILVAVGLEAMSATMKATSAIPIVVVGGADPVAEGWATSFEKPGGHVTGLTVTTTGLIARRLELLREVLPALSRVALLWPADLSQAELAGWSEAAPTGVTLQHFSIRGPADLAQAIEKAAARRAEGLYIAESPMIYAHRAQIADLALRKQFPAIGTFRQSAEAGLLMAYSVDLADVVRRAAIYVDKILLGANAGDLAVGRPSKFELVINLKTSRALRLTIPSWLGLRADQVIE